MQKFGGNEGEADYYKSTPSGDPVNPVNGQGFRGPEIKEKKPGMTRIVCLGSSTTYGEGLIFADTYPAILQKKLDETFGYDKYEIINAGQPGLNLAQILSLTKHEILSLQPDIVILMNINNNFKAPGFWFVDIKGNEIQDTHPAEATTLLMKIRNEIVLHSACAFLIHDYQYQGIARYFDSFDWRTFSKKLMAPDNIWEKEFAENLDKILQILFEHNPQIQIILIEEAVNRIRHPELEAPFNKARQIMRDKAKKYKNVCTLDVETAIINAHNRGEPVWQNPSLDPLHLIRRGNEIIVSLLMPCIISQ